MPTQSKASSNRLPFARKSVVTASDERIAVAAVYTASAAFAASPELALVRHTYTHFTCDCYSVRYNSSRCN